LTLLALQAKYNYKKRGKGLEAQHLTKEFDRIEQRLDRLIAICQSYEATNAQLKNRITQLEEELQAKVEAENRIIADKALIRNRIDSLIQKIEGISIAQEA
jgi:hypothetical protein